MGDKYEPSNYRGITVTPVILKVLEHILNERHNEVLLKTQSRLQKGFTAGSSSMGAALILTECINESKNKKENLFVATLDVQKAFDVVNHDLLLRKIYIDGIRGNDWLLLREIYSDMTSSVKWEGHLSSPFIIRQGVRQGGVLSTSHYKRNNNQLLLQLENKYTGSVIGCLRIPHITVADDLALQSNSGSEMQYMLDDSGGFANQDRYVIHPSKSCVLRYGAGSRVKDDSRKFTMLGKKVKVEQQTTHLGIFRDTIWKVNIEEKLSLARRAAYALMGAGLHAGTGLSKTLCSHLWCTYVVPRLVYGLEVHKLTCSDVNNLEKFQRKCLRQIQGLPDKTPNCVSLSLLGVLPIETVIHKNILNLFVNSARAQNSIEYEVLQRQLVMKTTDENTWCNEVKRLLGLYKLPSAYERFENPPFKSAWKSMLNSKLNDHVQTYWRKDIQEKTSLRYLNSASVGVGIVHQCWTSVRYNIQDIKRAELKVKLLTGSYILQANRACFSQYAVDPTFKLCHQQPEGREHFIAQCQSLEHIRAPFRSKLQNLLIDTDLQFVSNDLGTFTQIVLDCSMVFPPDILKDIDSHKVELWSRELIFKLHSTRLMLLKRVGP